MTTPTTPENLATLAPSDSSLMHGILGKSTDYPKTYSPDILYPIPRALGREALAIKEFVGVDYWHAFELSWLDDYNVSCVAMARLTIPADSPYIVESKSLKLYLNSFNFTNFSNKQMVIDVISRDLSKCLNANVGVELFDLLDGELQISAPSGECIDGTLSKKVEIVNDVDGNLLADEQYCQDEIVRQVYHSNLLRSNCPVTNQPDWGVVEICIESGQLNPEKLLAYILSYRHHNGFHEQCVEQIFSDLTTHYQPKSLMVRAWYTRRGGIDINPVRVSDKSLLSHLKYTRLIRQ